MPALSMPARHRWFASRPLAILQSLTPTEAMSNYQSQSKRIKVVVTDYVEPDLAWEAEQMAGLQIDFEAYQLKSASEGELAAATKDADILVVNMAPVKANLVSQWRNCSLVIRHGIGHDNVDVAALTARRIRFANIPDYCVEEVAEHAIALMFALGRKLVFSRTVLESCSKRGQWDFAPVEPIHRMKGQTVGIIGYGRIGRCVYERLRGFGFNFRICDPYVKPKGVTNSDPPLVPHETVYRESDFISLHTPLNQQTRHIINEQSIKMMKPSAVLINTARAGLIDHEALHRAIIQGRLAGAGIDVFDPEPPSPDNPLFGLPNVILTPHLSWYSVESGEAIRRKIVEEIRLFQAGVPPTHWINRDDLRRQELQG